MSSDFENKHISILETYIHAHEHSRKPCTFSGPETSALHEEKISCTHVIHTPERKVPRAFFFFTIMPIPYIISEFGVYSKNFVVRVSIFQVAWGVSAFPVTFKST